jgi:hypothetical protein
VLQLQATATQVKYRWQNVIAGFNMPVKLTNGQWISPTATWQTATLQNASDTLTADPNFYIQIKKS